MPCARRGKTLPDVAVISQPENTIAERVAIKEILIGRVLTVFPLIGTVVLVGRIGVLIRTGRIHLVRLAGYGGRHERRRADASGRHRACRGKRTRPDVYRAEARGDRAGIKGSRGGDGALPNVSGIDVDPAVYRYAISRTDCIDG